MLGKRGDEKLRFARLPLRAASIVEPECDLSGGGIDDAFGELLANAGGARQLQERGRPQRRRRPDP